jgi:hypothetical protein
MRYPLSGSRFRRIRLYNTYMLALVQSKFFLLFFALSATEEWTKSRALVVVSMACGYSFSCTYLLV